MICAVGEAPAREEMFKNRPFVGRAGQVLNEILHNADVLRTEISISNFSTHPLTDNEKKELLGPRGLTPKGRAYAEGLRERLKNHQANVFVPLGNLALAALTDTYGPKRGITRLRGSILSSSLLPGKKVIPTIHPAATLPGRGPYTQRYTIANDFRKIKRHSKFPELRLPQRDLMIHPKLYEVKDMIEACRREGRFGSDIETLNFHVSCLSLAPTPNMSMCIPFYGDPWTLEEECYIWRELASLFGDRDVEKIWQFGTSFDIPFLMLVNKILFRGAQHDIGVAHRILHPDFPASLEFLTSVYTDEPYYKDDRKLWSAPSKDLDTFYRYNCKDSAVLPEIHDEIYPEILADEALTNTLNMTMANLEPCLYMMLRGDKVDEEKLSKTKTSIDEDLKVKEQELKDVAEIEFNPNSPKQCIKYFYGIKNLRPYISRKTGRPTCDDTALARICRRDKIPEAKLVQEIRSLLKLRSTYLELRLDLDKRLRCVYDIRGTVSGRLSSRKTPIDTGLNKQNLDPRFKPFIVVDDPTVSQNVTKISSKN